MKGDGRVVTRTQDPSTGRIFFFFLNCYSDTEYKTKMKEKKAYDRCVAAAETVRGWRTKRVKGEREKERTSRTLRAGRDSREGIDLRIALRLASLVGGAGASGRVSCCLEAWS